MFPFDMLSLLGCPSCKGPELGPEGKKQTQEFIEEGTLTCTACGESCLILSGVSHMLPQGELNTAAWTRQPSAIGRQRPENGN